MSRLPLRPGYRLVRHAEVDLLAHALRERGTPVAVELAAALEEAAVHRELTGPPSGTKSIVFYPGAYADVVLAEELRKLRGDVRPNSRRRQRQVDGLRCAAAPAVAAVMPSIVRHVRAPLAAILAAVALAAFAALAAALLARHARPRRPRPPAARVTVEVSPTIAAWRRVGQALDEIDVADESGPNLRAASPDAMNHHTKEQ
ncbi:hypothetical protein [Mycobacterium sp.]|uniref:hypothetical protein n=1 Tax=Mycobacterium sp. TaxID=1785 RepID=UPI002621ABD9|nr:hypothetical protein [Mycobacterium sp.]